LIRPEAAARLLGGGLRDFANAKIGLEEVFGDGDVALLAETLAKARSSRERLASVQHFLLEKRNEQEPDQVACAAAARLRSNPSLRVRQLAADLGISERQLSRRFQALFGTSPKSFARASRVEKIVAARRSGSSWAEVAYACGFADQAHMINDVGTIVGASPDLAFHHERLFAH
jgi:AraC-like DNA-binding protein